jgi:hypothetical protein
MFVSQETLKAANSGYYRDTDKDRDTKLKNASSRNEKPAWLTTYENTVGSIDNNSIGNNADDEEFKQASSNNNSNEMPNWLVTYRNTVGF